MFVIELTSFLVARQPLRYTFQREFPPKVHLDYLGGKCMYADVENLAILEAIRGAGREVDHRAVVILRMAQVLFDGLQPPTR